ncbi:hypothetical protein PV11_00840 [Exophiala sideris]|uniref:Uncharacterized protein n=1 Tax=Exophiala sideris TaxID=1016849 RepID=A0A0D1W8N4_9EURO|nr:hypothetical protein PV11_00840 [Exophiala sideris]
MTVPLPGDCGTTRATRTARSSHGSAEAIVCHHTCTSFWSAKLPMAERRPCGPRSARLHQMQQGPSIVRPGCPYPKHDVKWASVGSTLARSIVSRRSTPPICRLWVPKVYSSQFTCVEQGQGSVGWRRVQLLLRNLTLCRSRLPRKDREIHDGKTFCFIS